MGLDQPYQKGGTVRWMIILAIGWTLLSPDSSSRADGRSPEKLFNAGMGCQERLHDSPKRQKLRQNWESCIRRFDVFLTQYPKNPQAEKSLFVLGELYAGLYHYSNKPQDNEKSREYYRTLIMTYPDGPYAREAQRRLDPLKKPERPVPITTVQNIRHWIYPDYTRLVLDMDRDVDFRQDDSRNDSRDDPNREILRITLNHTRLSPEAKKGVAELTDGLLQRITLRPSATDGVQVYINVKSLREPPKIIPLSNPGRLVIDLFGPTPAGSPDLPDPPAPSLPKMSGGRVVVAQAEPIDVRTIVVDPGHGGKDPGAIGRAGLTEKDVVLDIGLRLRSLIQERLGRKVIMTREDDTFIPLDDRTLIANSKKADLFVSIHVNSHPQRRTRGVEIYHLGQSSDRHAMAVAARENNVSIQSLDNLDRTVKQILFDLGRDYNMDQSQNLAFFTRRSFQTTLENRYDYTVVDHGVKRAPFYVLLNSNMPSILAEVSFISNPTEEKLLRQSQYRQAIAESLFQGIRAYLSALKPIS
jgi:N-acetylmuramoyl-L-alanine amidase